MFGILLVEGVVEIVSVLEGGRPLPRHHHHHLMSAMVQFCHLPQRRLGRLLAILPALSEVRDAVSRNHSRSARWGEPILPITAPSTVLNYPARFRSSVL